MLDGEDAGGLDGGGMVDDGGGDVSDGEDAGGVGGGGMVDEDGLFGVL